MPFVVHEKKDNTIKNAIPSLMLIFIKLPYH